MSSLDNYVCIFCRLAKMESFNHARICVMLFCFLFAAVMFIIDLRQTTHLQIADLTRFLSGSYESYHLPVQIAFRHLISSLMLINFVLLFLSDTKVLFIIHCGLKCFHNFYLDTQKPKHKPSLS